MRASAVKLTRTAGIRIIKVIPFVAPQHVTARLCARLRSIRRNGSGILVEARRIRRPFPDRRQGAPFLGPQILIAARSGWRTERPRERSLCAGPTRIGRLVRLSSRASALRALPKEGSRAEAIFRSVADPSCLALRRRPVQQRSPIPRGRLANGIRPIRFCRLH